MTIKLFLISILLFTGVGCTNIPIAEITNGKEGQLHATHKLKVSDTKKFPLDSLTAPKPQYTQIFKDSTGTQYFTFLNTYNNAIYFYDYHSLNFIKKISYSKSGADGIQSAKGYYIKNMDSIYIYNIPLIELVLANNISKIKNKISLKGDNDSKTWYMDYPQYLLKTASPFIAIQDKLLFSGQYFFSIPESGINKFKFTAQIDLKSGKVNFMHTYPQYLYGSGYNWEGGLFTEVFAELHPDGDKIIYSFPVSHNLYIADLNTNDYKEVYAGSNFAGTIHSINHKSEKTTDEMKFIHYARQDLYTAIRYDKYRKLYYRFLLRAIPDATVSTRKEEKHIAVIVMDNQFHYLGETVIGTGNEWYWQNSFVTKEGLNIEYTGAKNDENFLTLKVFTLKKI